MKIEQPFKIHEQTQAPGVQSKSNVEVLHFLCNYIFAKKIISVKIENVNKKLFSYQKI